MTADGGAFIHFIDNQLLPGIELKMNHYVHLNPPATINVAGNHRLYGVGQGILVVQMLHHLGSKHSVQLHHLGSQHSVQLPVTIVPGLGRHLFSEGPAAIKGVNMIIAKNSYLDVGVFTVPLRKDSHCSTLDHLDPTTDAISRTSETAFPTISGSNFKLETILVVHAATGTKATSLSTPVRANIWHKRLGHPNVQATANVKNIVECGNIFQTLYRRAIRATSTRALNRNTLRHRGLTLPANV